MPTILYGPQQFYSVEKRFNVHEFHQEAHAGKELPEMPQAFSRRDYKAAQDIHFCILDIVNALCTDSHLLSGTRRAVVGCSVHNTQSVFADCCSSC